MKAVTAKVVKLNESSFKQTVSENIEQESAIVTPDEVMMFLEAIIEGTSDFLRSCNTVGRTVVVFKDLKGNFITAAAVEYNENEEEDGQDNFNYYWSFDEADALDPKSKVIEGNSDQVLVKILGRVKSRSYTMLSEYMVYLEGKIFSGLLDFANKLSAEVTETESISIEHDGYFKITIALEDGTICKSFIPDGPIKTLIKNDCLTTGSLESNGMTL